MTVPQIKKLIEYAYYLHNENELQAGGLDFDIITDNHGKVEKIKLYKNGKELISGKFKVAINDYMFSAYSIEYEKVLQEFEKPDAEVIIDYLKKKKVVN